jgi:uncharacterized membrane protein
MPTPLKPEPTPEQLAMQLEWENPANWRLGLFYFAPKDPRPWVPKRSSMGRRRFGVTPNLANRAARNYLFITLGVFVGLLVLLSLLQKAGVIR